MKNVLQDVIIAILVIIICFVITSVTKASFFWLLLPIVFVLLLATLGKLLREKYGSSYGITIYLFLFFAVPLLWYWFCLQMPITALTLETQQKVEDFSSFQNYEGSIDAKQQFVVYQLRQDSILKQEVSRLLSENKVDQALQLIKDNKSNSEKLKKELFNTSDSQTDKKVNSSTNNKTQVERINSYEVIVHFDPTDTIYTGLITEKNDTYYFINPTAPFKVEGYSQKFHKVSTDMVFEAKGKAGNIKIYGDGYSGSVRVKLEKHN